MGCLLRMMQIFKIKTYQQAVLRFGLPFIILYRGTHYLFYRLAWIIHDFASEKRKGALKD